MLLKVAFQMDADVVVGKDLTVQFIQESKRRGHDVFFTSRVISHSREVRLLLQPTLWT